LLIVSVDGGIGHENKGGSGVSNTGEAAHRSASRADLELGRGILPETVAAVNIGVLEGASELGGIGGTEVVGSIGVLGEVSREDGLVKTRLGVVEEGLGRGWLHSVDAAEGKAQKSVSGARDEGGGDLGGQLDHLTGDLGASNGNVVGTGSTAGSRAVGILDAPGAARLSLVGRALAGVVDVVSLLGAGVQLAGENPPKDIY
jgi:hypothetical protein